MNTNKFAADHVVSGQPVSVLRLEQVKGHQGFYRTADRLWFAQQVKVHGCPKLLWKLTGDYVTI
jgi:hypothetical protein